MKLERGGDGGIDHDEVARLCTGAYVECIPARGAKPARRSNGVFEWTVLAGFVISYLDNGRQYRLMSLATGLKCASYSQVTQSRGDVLHDSHAEVLARRGARYWLLARLQAEQTAQTTIDGRPGLFEQVNDQEGRWTLRKDVHIHLYISTLPCGDASTVLFEFQRARQDVDANRVGAATPLDLLHKYAARPPIAEGGSIRTESALSRGRAAGSTAGLLGQLRTKPGRPDSPASISMSCSDKLALWSSIGIQGSLLSAVLDPVRISSVTVSDSSLTATGLGSTPSGEITHPAQQLQFLLQTECSRSLNRVVSAEQQQVAVAFTSVQFSDSKECIDRIARENQPGSEVATAPGSILYVPPISMAARVGQPPLVLENLVAGTRLGASTKRNPQTPFLLKQAARSSVCKLAWYNHLAHLAPSVESSSTYWHTKRRAVPGTQRYRARKQELIGSLSDQAKIDAVTQFLASTNTSTTATDTKDHQHVAAESTATKPIFAGWLVTPSFVEHFQLDGNIPHSSP